MAQEGDISDKFRLKESKMLLLLQGDTMSHGRHSGQGDLIQYGYNLSHLAFNLRKRRAQWTM